MDYIFEITRRKDDESEAYIQKIHFETEDENETVASSLRKINGSGDYVDENGDVVEQITWEAGCLQKKCGACAMLINGQPRLACDAFLKEMKKNKTITLEPLSKFPVIRDLAVDRSIMFENLRQIRLWMGQDAQINQKYLDDAFDGARCLQCGCCLEACPNFYPGGRFFSAAAYAPQARLISTYTQEEMKEMKSLYNSHIYEGCAKALACQKVCPAQIDLDRILSRSNAISIWHRH